MLFNRFSFTYDFKFIYLTFFTAKDDNLFKTVVLDSLTLNKIEDGEFYYLRKMIQAEDLLGNSLNYELKGKIILIITFLI